MHLLDTADKHDTEKLHSVKVSKRVQGKPMLGDKKKSW